MKGKAGIKCIVLSLLLVVSFIPQMVFAADYYTVRNEGNLEYSVYSGTVSFGSYPQTEIVYDKSAAGTYGKSWASDTDYIVDANLYTKLLNAKWDW